MFHTALDFERDPDLYVEELALGSKEEAERAINYLRARCEVHVKAAAACILMQRREEIEDVLAETFVTALVRRSSIKKATFGYARNWLCAIARNRAIDLLRSRSREWANELNESFDLPQEPNDLDNVRNEFALKQALNVALSAINPRQREIVVEVLQECAKGQTMLEPACAQAAENLKLSKGRVKQVFLKVRPMLQSDPALRSWVHHGVARYNLL